MEIIIGRDAKTSQLDIKIGQQTIRLGAPGSVPQTVSRQHCRIATTPGGYAVENLKAENMTCINGMAIERKTMRPTDTLTLGPDRYTVDLRAVLAAIDKLTPKTADIRPLRKVWDDHEQYILNTKIKNGKFVALSTTTGLFTMGAVAVSFIPGVPPTCRIPFYVIAIILILTTFIKRWRDATNLPLQQKKKEEEFHRQYSCPSCGHRFSMHYDELLNYDSCPFCKAKFIK